MTGARNNLKHTHFVFESQMSRTFATAEEVVSICRNVETWNCITKYSNGFLKYKIFSRTLLTNISF